MEDSNKQNFNAISSLVTLQMEQVALLGTMLSLMVEEKTKDLPPGNEKEAFIKKVYDRKHEIFNNAKSLLIPVSDKS